MRDNGDNGASGANPFSDGNADSGIPGESYAQKLARELEQSKKDLQALQSELHKVADENITDDDVRNAFKPYVPNAIASIISLAETADGEGVRLSASKYIIETASRKLDNDSDEFKELMKRFGGKSKPVPAE